MKFCTLLLKILSGNENRTSIKGHYSVNNLRKMSGNNHKVDPASIKATAKFGEILSIGSWDIERKHEILSGNEI